MVGFYRLQQESPMNLTERLGHYLGKKPKIGDACHVHPTAVILGDVTLGHRVSVWPQAVLRADLNSIIIGDETNLQDGCILHLSTEQGVNVGARVTVGPYSTPAPSKMNA
jgi:gamma-carbonic anhydrase